MKFELDLFFIEISFSISFFINNEAYKIPNSTTMETSLWKMNTVDVMDDSITDFNLDNIATFNSKYKIKKYVLLKMEFIIYI